MITIDTHNIERVLYIIFLEATSKTIEAKVIDATTIRELISFFILNSKLIKYL